MNRFLTSIFLLLFSFQFSYACSTFCLQDSNQLIFGRNYDWDIDAGYIMVNKRGLLKTSVVGVNEKPVTWVSKYGSITFNQYGKEFPLGGMNEAGLVVEVMWLRETLYPIPDTRPVLRELQWVQYQLDNFSFVEEVIKSDKYIRIASYSLPVHFLICDKLGNTATIELINGKMVVHSNATLPVKVLTNDTYLKSTKYLSQHTGFGGKKNIPLSDYSLDRFVRLASQIKNYQKKQNQNIINDAFDMLYSVSGTRTQWSIVYDISNRKIYIKTRANQEMKFVELGNFDMECSTTSSLIDINTNLTGDINNSFVEYSTEINRRLIYYSIKNTEALKSFPNEKIEQLSQYPEGIKCN